MSLTLTGLILLGMPGIPEMLVIGGIVVLLFGATKLPKLGKGLGEGIRNFKNGLTGNNPDKSESKDDDDSLVKTDESSKS